VVHAYSDDTFQETVRRTKFDAGADCAGSARFGSREIELASIDVMSSQGEPRAEFQCGEPVHVEINYFSPEAIRDPVFFMSISEEEGKVAFQAATDGAINSIPVVEGHGRLSLRVRDLQLKPGKYYVDVGVYEKDWKYAYDYHSRVQSISFRNGPAGYSGNDAGKPRADWAVA
jgi:lipopolysaccharide transport system ATP-binding protein